MHNWAAQDWVTLISALVAAFTSAWNAVHGKTIINTLDRHDAAQRHRHQETLAALGKGPAKKD